jgi:TolB-like protein/tetratricopeptide (TPR) repeat protein
VKDLRHVLGDDGVRQRYIQTLRGSGYRFVSPAVEPAPGREERDATLITVLPFEDLSNGHACAELSQGLVGALVESLSRCPGLRVIPSPSSRSETDRRSVSTMARELEVDVALTGSVRHNHDHIRVAVQLLDAEDGGLVWVDHFDHTSGEGQGLEEALVGAIVARVADAAGPKETATRVSTSSSEGEACEVCISARYHQRQGTREALVTARGEYERAIEEAPQHPVAYVGLARVLLALCGYTQQAPRGGESVPREAALPRATVAAGKAIELDPSFGPAHAVRGTILGVFEWKWGEAKMAITRAVELSPRDAECQMDHAKLMAALGNTSWGVEGGRRAVDLDPLNVPLRLDYADLLHFARRPEDALREQQRVLAMDPHMPSVHGNLGVSYERLGRYEEAIEAWMRMFRVMRFPKEAQKSLARAFEVGGMSSYWRAWVEVANNDVFRRYFPPEWLWVPFSRLRDFDHAFEWLDYASEKRSETLAYINVDLRFDPLREDPRFELLRKRVGVPA